MTEIRYHRIMIRAIICLTLTSFLLLSCSQEAGIDPNRQRDLNYNPVLPPQDFYQIPILNNPFFPFDHNKTYIYSGLTDDGSERIEVQRKSEIRIIQEIPCLVIHEKGFENGLLVEDGLEWYAQNIQGEVWYLGTEITNYNSNGNVINTFGSWIAGQDEALPGKIMLMDPKVGEIYRQEYVFNLAENQAEIIARNRTVETPAGVFENCLVVREFSELEPDEYEFKYYAPGIGLVLEEDPVDNTRISLSEIIE